MGAFFLSPQRFNIEPVHEVFSKKGFGKPMEVNTRSGIALIYKKQLLSELNYRIIGESLLFSVGTVFYKNSNFTDSLDAIFKDYVEGALDLTLMVGSFFIYIEHEGQSCFFSDRAGIQNVFFNHESGVISSSFLAVLTAMGEIAGKQTINKQSVCEVLTTGNLIGPDTLIEGIERYEPAIHADLPGMKKIDWINDKQEKQNNSESRSMEVAKQLHYLSKYFDSCAEPLKHYGISSGLTGGFDSRLLYLVFKRFTKNYQVYSTHRENPGPEFRCAQNFARAAEEKLLSLTHTLPEKMSAVELSKTLTDNFYFNDGLIRSHQLWLEEIKGRDYLKKLYGPFRVGFSGVGGEQYRNGEYLVRNRYSFRSWIRNELVERVSGLPFLNSKSKSVFLLNLRTKIANLLAMPACSKYISKNEIKRYYNEIWNPANRTLRNNIENQLAFFISPFTDYQVARNAYDAISYLGSGPEFEMEMIRRLSPELANCKTNYGFSISNKVSFKLRILPYIKSLLGLKLYNHLFNLQKRKKRSSYELLLRKHPRLNELVTNVVRLNLPLNLKKLKRSNFLSPLLIETGYFLTEMKKHIEL